MTLLSDLATILSGWGLGTPATDIFGGRMPNTPAVCISVETYAGMSPQYVAEQARPGYLRPSIQVLIRDTDYANAAARADLAFDALGSVRNSGNYLAIRPIQSPFYLRHDENNRVLFAFNCDVLLKRSA